MSANNQIVIVEKANGLCGIWEDSCVDNPFPESARLVEDNLTHTQALRYAQASVEAGGIEYGIRFISYHREKRVDDPILRRFQAGIYNP